MKVLSTCMVISSLAVLAAGCQKKTEQAPEQAFEVVRVEVSADEPPPMPTDDHPPVPNVGDPGHGQEKLTAEDPPPPPTGHRLRLGIDGDPGYTQDELTEEELAEARAAGARVPQPSYGAQPSEPPTADRPNEGSEDEEDESSDTIYVDGTRAPVYRRHVREEAGADRPADPRPATQPHRVPHR
jgi:hypothetical protein